MQISRTQSYQGRLCNKEMILGEVFVSSRQDSTRINHCLLPMVPHPLTLPSPPRQFSQVRPLQWDLSSGKPLQLRRFLAILCPFRHDLSASISVLPPLVSSCATREKHLASRRLMTTTVKRAQRSRVSTLQYLPQLST